MIDDVAATLARAAAAGVERCVHIGCTPRRVVPALALARRARRRVLRDRRPPARRHPRRRQRPSPSSPICSRDPRVVGRRRDRPRLLLRPLPARRAQQTAMAAQLEIARASASRSSCTSATPTPTPGPSSTPPAVPGIVHCFTGTPDEAREWLRRGYHLSFSGIATFPNARGRLREAARICPPTASCSRPTPRTSPPSRSGAARTSPPTSPTPAPAWPPCAASPEELARTAAANAAALFQLPPQVDSPARSFYTARPRAPRSSQPT
jgi:TatD DNase family protein